MPDQPLGDRILDIAQEIVEGCEGVIANVERLAAELSDETPIDCEGFRVALFYAKKVLAAAERGEFDEIEPAWLEPIKRIGVEKNEQVNSCRSDARQPGAPGSWALYSELRE